MRRLTIIGIVCLALLAGCGGAINEPDTSGGIAVDNVTAILTLPTDTGAVYMQITNSGDTDDALIGATIPGCGTVELHEVIMQDDVMTMRQIEGNRIPVPAGETVLLQRGGLHVMCIDKTGEFAVGDAVPVTLTFETAGTLDITAEVIDPGEMPMESNDGMGADEGN